MIKKQISKKKEESCCVYSCPQCGNKDKSKPACPPETVPFLMKTNSLDSIKKHGVDGYDVVTLVDANTRQMAVFSNVSGRLSPEDLHEDRSIHMQAFEHALKGNIHHYEWSIEKANKQLFFQTTLIPLCSAKGSVGNVLALTRDITNWGGGYGSERVFKDWSSPRTFSQILLAARETEKKEISKALHDEIGSAAVILTALLSLVKASVKEGNSKQALADISKLDVQIKDSIERVKNIVVTLRPPSLENDGALGGSIRELLESISSYVHIPHSFEYDPSACENGISDSVKILLYRIVQEALNNIVKHSHAKHIYVLLGRKKDAIRLVVEDDGVGFKMLKQGSIRKVGLLAMKDSVRLLGGTISIKSAPGKGTRIEVTCPCVVYGGKE